MTTSTDGLSDTWTPHSVRLMNTNGFSDTWRLRSVTRSASSVTRSKEVQEDG